MCAAGEAKRRADESPRLATHDGPQTAHQPFEELEHWRVQYEVIQLNRSPPPPQPPPAA